VTKNVRRLRFENVTINGTPYPYSHTIAGK
jgi:hypothetical protein